MHPAGFGHPHGGKRIVRPGRQAQQGFVDGGHGHERGDLVAGTGLGHGPGRDPVAEDHGPAQGQGAQQGLVGVDENRHHAQVHVVRGQGESVDGGCGIGQEVAQGRHRALGRAGGAGGEVQIDRVVGFYPGQDGGHGAGGQLGQGRRSRRGRSVADHRGHGRALGVEGGQGRQVFGGHDQDRRGQPVEDGPGHLRRLVGVQREKNAAGSGGGQEGGDGLGRFAGIDGQALARGQAQAGQSAGQAQGGFGQGFVGHGRVAGQDGRRAASGPGVAAQHPGQGVVVLDHASTYCIKKNYGKAFRGPRDDCRAERSGIHAVREGKARWPEPLHA